MKDPQCPECKSDNTYRDSNLWVCPMCSHEWTDEPLPKSTDQSSTDASVRDANGNVLSDGDSVVVIKDLKIKGASSTIKSGTKVKNIRLSDAGDGHDISCKIDGIGAINLKSQFVRKA